MLLFFCKICNDVAALPQDKSWRCCRCSRSAARYKGLEILWKNVFVDTLKIDIEVILDASR